MVTTSPESNATDQPVATADIFLSGAGYRHLVQRRAVAEASAPRTDPLTGALDRHAFIERGATLQRSAMRLHCELSLAVVDVDRLAAINARDGWAAGNACLAAAADLLRQGDRVVCRWSGDAFAVIMPGVGRIEAAEELRRTLDVASRNLIGGSQPITFCAGVTDLDPEGILSRELDRAQRMLDRARRQGDGRVVEGRRNE